MIEQTPTRRRTLNTWRAQNETKLIGLPTKKASDLLAKSYVITHDAIAEIKSKRAQEFPCNNCSAAFKTEKGLKIHKRSC